MAVAGGAVGLPGALVTEILRPRPLTQVPLGPQGLLGVANLRGQMLPVVSLAALLGALDAAASPAARIVVVACAGGVGLLVDAVLAFGADPAASAIDVAALLAQRFDRAARPAPMAAVRPTAPPQAGAAIARNATALVGLRVAGQDYALALDEVAEIAAFPAEVTMVPGTGPAMLGVIAWRGGLLPLLSLRVLLGMAQDGDTGPGAGARVAVAFVAGRPVGLIVDAVTGILHVPHAAFEPVPAVLVRGHAETQVQAICRLDGGRRLVAQLSSAHLLDVATIARLQTDQPNAAMPAPSSADAASGEAVVVVSVGGAAYGLPLAAVDEVVRHPGALTRVPQAPGFVQGVMNLRGQIVPVLDPHQLFGGAQPASARGRRVVLTRIGTVKAGFAVDAASAVVTVRPSDLQPAPPLAVGAAPIFDRIATRRADGSMILLVDPRTLLDAAERDLLAAIAQRAASAAA